MSNVSDWRGLATRLAVCALAAALSGCAADSASRDWRWWNNTTVRMEPLTPGPASPDAFVNPDGSCPGDGGVPAGIALGMTECDLVRLVGPSAQIDIGANPRGERETVITYRSGDRPGVYRFTAGRLAEVERAPEPPPKPQRATKPKPKPRQSAL